MLGRKIVAVIIVIMGVGLIVFALLVARGVIDQTAMRGSIFQGLTEGSPVMYFILGAATAAFGLYILIAVFRRRE
ncbi:MAG: hypothetical protein JXD23_09100 [Spirochaetales bacterium]|nr:hypothetical protein [Spirochaetales bacterium]